MWNSGYIVIMDNWNTLVYIELEFTADSFNRVTSHESRVKTKRF